MLPAWISSRPRPLTNEKLFAEAKCLQTQNNFISKLINIQSYKDKPILELESGLGSFALELRKLGFRFYHGIDSKEENIQFSSSAIGPYFTKDSLPSKVGLPSNHFAAIFAFDVLQTTTNILEFINHIHEHLEKNGIFVGTTPYPFTRNIIENPEYLHVLHPRNWKRLFHLCKFRMVETYPMSFIPHLWKINPTLNPVLPTYVPGLNMPSNTLIIAKKGA